MDTPSLLTKAARLKTPYWQVNHRMQKNHSVSRRIVLISTMPPLPFGHPPGGRWTYVLFKGLVERGHRVTMLVPCYDAGQQEELRDIFHASDYDLRTFLVAPQTPPRLRDKWYSFRRPHSYVFPPALYRDVATVLSKPWDILHMEDIWAGWVGLPYDRRKAVLNYLNLYRIDDGGRSCHSWRDFLDCRLRRHAEARLAKAYPNILALTSRLASELRMIAPRSHVDIIPLGIDLSRYEFRASCGYDDDVPVVSLIGSMHWYPSFSAAERLLTRLWPAIKSKIPKARCQIVGWSAKNALRQYVGMPDVEIAENVPDIQPYFERTNVLLYAPGRGSGMKLKVMEAFAYGIPVVTTWEGVEGLAAQDGIHAGICDEDQGLIERTVSLLRQHDRRESQRLAARRLLESDCSPEATLNLVERCYENIYFRQGW